MKIQWKKKKHNYLILAKSYSQPKAVPEKTYSFYLKGNWLMLETNTRLSSFN